MLFVKTIVFQKLEFPRNQHSRFSPFEAISFPGETSNANKGKTQFLRHDRFKRPFILIEIFIAIALLSTCAIPLISSSIMTYKKRKSQLIELELERKAEFLFYNFLKKELPSISYEDIQIKKDCLKKDLEAMPIGIDNQTLTFYPHYHLYHDHKKLQETMIAKCKICIPKEKGKCSNTSYKFEFFVKKLAEKSIDQHVNNKEKNSEHHEKLPSNLQTVRPIE